MNSYVFFSDLDLRYIWHIDTSNTTLVFQEDVILRVIFKDACIFRKSSHIIFFKNRGSYATYAYNLLYTFVFEFGICLIKV